MPRLRTRPTTWITVIAAAAFVAGACTSGDQQGPSPSRSGEPTAGHETELAVTLTGLSAQPGPAGRVTLIWDALDDIPSYQVEYGAAAVHVPASICAQDCTLTVAPQQSGRTLEMAVRAVRGGATSKPAVTDVTVPADAEPTDHEVPLEVVLVYAGDPPEVQRVPVDSPEQGQAAIEDAQAAALTETDRVLLSASMNTPTEANAAPAADDGSATGLPWQAEAMRFDLLPGDPPGQGVTVAVIEMDGLDASHPVFDGATILDGVHLGDDAASGLTGPELHATVVTSMIAGQPGTAVPGIAPGATILPVNKGDGSAASLVEAIVWAVDNGADVVNISVSGQCESFGPFESCPDSIQAGTDYAEANGVVVVASAGNNGDGADWCDEPHHARKWPAVLDTVISVGGFDQARDPWVCTPRRPDVDLLAPAAQMLLPEVGGGYVLHHGGTSAAAPLVAGLVAVILAERPELTPADIRAMLPRWRTANGSVSVPAVLLEAGLIDWDDPQTEDFENAEWVFPYRLDLLFEGDHPMALAVPEGPERVSAVRSEISWSNRYSGDRQQDGKVFFGEVEGLLLVDADDGSVTGSAVFSYRHGSAFTAARGGEQISYSGHWIECPESLGAPLGGYRKVFRWDIPVTVSGSLVPGTEDNPALDLTFSLGIGATADQHGELPGITVAYDTMQRCQAAMDAYVGTVEDPYVGNSEYSSWGELESLWDEYEQTMESIYETLVSSSPFTLADPVQPRYTRTMTTADDERVTIVFSEPEAKRPHTYD